MARYHHAIWKGVGRYAPGGTSGGAMPSCGRLILHTAVSASDSLFPLFNTPGNAVAHFYVRADGTVEQYVDTDRRASAVLDGNYDAITVESQDIGGPFPRWTGSNVPQWTEAQVEAIAKLAAWCHKVHGIPLQRLASSRRGRKGIGWHRQGIDGAFPRTGLLRGRVLGGERWSSSAGKVCPGDHRILQVPSIIRRAQRIADGSTTVVSVEPVKRDQGRVDHALQDVHQSIQATRKGSPLRDKLRRIARLLRKLTD